MHIRSQWFGYPKSICIIGDIWWYTTKIYWNNHLYSKQWMSLKCQTVPNTWSTISILLARKNGVRCRQVTNIIMVVTWMNVRLCPTKYLWKLNCIKLWEAIWKVILKMVLFPYPKNNHITGGCIINTTNPIFISSKVWNSCSSLTSTRKLIQNIFTVLHISIFSGLTVFVMNIFAHNFTNIKHFKYFSVISSSILCASKLVLTIWTKWYSL